MVVAASRELSPRNPAARCVQPLAGAKNPAIRCVQPLAGVKNPAARCVQPLAGAKGQPVGPVTSFLSGLCNAIVLLNKILPSCHVIFTRKKMTPPPPSGAACVRAF